MTFKVEVNGVIPNLEEDALVPGVQAVSIVYTALSGDWYRAWQVLDLQLEDPDRSNWWTGQLTVPPTVPAADVRYFVQAVGANGLTSLATNFGDYYQLDVDPGVTTLPAGIGDTPPEDTALVLLHPAATGR